jgi:hypothetical protein
MARSSRGIDDELKPCRLEHRQVSRIFALEDAAGIEAGIATLFGDIHPVTHQPTDPE